MNETAALNNANSNSTKSSESHISDRDNDSLPPNTSPRTNPISSSSLPSTSNQTKMATSSPSNNLYSSPAHPSINNNNNNNDELFHDAPIKILVVDDEKTTRNVVSNLLTKMGYQGWMPFYCYCCHHHHHHQRHQREEVFLSHSFIFFALRNFHS